MLYVLLTLVLVINTKILEMKVCDKENHIYLQMQQFMHW